MTIERLLGEESTNTELRAGAVLFDSRTKARGLKGARLSRLCWTFVAEETCLDVSFLPCLPSVVLEVFLSLECVDLELLLRSGLSGTVTTEPRPFEEVSFLKDFSPAIGPVDLELLYPTEEVSCDILLREGTRLDTEVSWDAWKVEDFFWILRPTFLPVLSSSAAPSRETLLREEAFLERELSWDA